MYHALLGIVVTAVGLTAAHAADLSLTATPHSVGGLFSNPLIPAEGDTVTITVRAQVQGELADPVEAEWRLRSANGSTTHSERLKLTIEGSQASGSFTWTPPHNGLYTLRAVVDPDDRIAEDDRGNNEATLELPVVVSGRRPYFPWYAERDYLRWANLWAGGIHKEHLGRWLERGVRPLAWKWGNNLPGEPTEEDFYKMYLEMGECPGIAIDECGYYPTPETMEGFAACLRGLARAKQERPDRFVLMWHCGSFYPEQAARYRTACDLVVLESYVFYHAPHGLGTENIYDFLDMKMLPARQVDLLGPTGPQVITSIDLDPKYFNRGELENVICHLRRRWPEMRGFGIYGELTPRDLPEEQRAGAVADEQFVDRLCYEYFVAPVLTFLPGSLWVGRARDGSLQVEAAVSNIGGMDSGPVRAGLYVDGQLLKEFSIVKVPAGNSRLDNRVLLSAPWTPQPGRHELRARIEGAKGCTLLDQEIQVIRAF